MDRTTTEKEICTDRNSKESDIIGAKEIYVCGVVFLQKIFNMDAGFQTPGWYCGVCGYSIASLFVQILRVARQLQCQS